MGLKENNVVFFRSLTKKINSTIHHSVFFKIGKITRVHGVKGEIFVSLSPPIKEIPDQVVGQVVQLRRGSELCLEVVVQEACLHKAGMIVQLEGVGERQRAERLKGADLFVPKQLFSSLKGENIYLCEVLNFEVCDKKRGLLGKIFAFSDSGAQDLLLIRSTENNQVEIPFINEFITHIDFESEKIQVDLPLNWPGLEC